MMAGLMNDYSKAANYPFVYENFGIDQIDSYQGKSGQNAKAFIDRIVKLLSAEMSKDPQLEATWEVPFFKVEDTISIINAPLKISANTSNKIPFMNSEINRFY